MNNKKPSEFDYDAYVRWFDDQPEQFTHKVWQEGYAEGRCQEKHGIVEFPDLIAERPTGELVLKAIEQANKRLQNG